MHASFEERNSGKLRGGKFLILIIVWDPQGENSLSKVTYKRNRKFDKEFQKEV